MLITLLATEEAVLSSVESRLRELGGPSVEVSARRLDAAFYAEGVSDAGPFFLILQEQGLITPGELAARVRERLGPGRRLVLCMPQPTDRAAILEALGSAANQSSEDGPALAEKLEETLRALAGAALLIG